MPRPDKAATVAEIAQRFRAANAAVLTEYRGLSVSQLTELRRSLGGNATYAVVKNTLTSLAAAEAGVTAFEGRLTGPTAVAFVTGDPVEAARGLRDFARAHPALVIKGGILEGKELSADDVRQLADLEPREVLLARLAGAMKASLNQAAYLFVAPLSQTARVLDALRQKLEEAAPESLPTAVDSAAAGDAPDADEPQAVTEPAEGETAEETAEETAASDQS
jgi:large subunit ribosomal protein L10